MASASSVRERPGLENYLESCRKADDEQQAMIDPSAVQAALDRLRKHPEPEARMMRTADAFAPAYNVQTSVDAEHALIVAHAVTLDAADNRQLEPMAEAAYEVPERPATLNIVADKGYSNGEQAGRMEASGLLAHVPANRGVNNQGDGTLFDRSLFHYQPQSDSATERLRSRYG